MQNQQRSFLPPAGYSKQEEKCVEEDTDEVIMVGEGVDSFSYEMKSTDESECIHKLVDGLVGDVMSRGSGQQELRKAVAAAERAMEVGSVNTATSGSNGSNKILGRELTLQTADIQAFPSVLTMDGIEEEGTNEESDHEHSNYERSSKGETGKPFSRMSSAVNLKKTPIMDHIPEHQEASPSSSPRSAVSVESDRQSQQPIGPQTPTGGLDNENATRTKENDKRQGDTAQFITHIVSSHINLAPPNQFQIRSTHRTLLVLASVIILLTIVVTQTSVSKLIHQKTTIHSGDFKLWNKMQQSQENLSISSEETTSEQQTPQTTISDKENYSIASFKHESSHVQESTMMSATMQLAPARERVAFQSISSWAFDKSIQWEKTTPSQPHNHQRQMTSSEFMSSTIRSRCNQHVAENAFKVWAAQYFVHTQSGRYIAQSEAKKALQELVVHM